MLTRRRVASVFAALALGLGTLLPGFLVTSPAAADHCGGFHQNAFGGSTFTTTTSSTSHTTVTNLQAPGGPIEQFRTRVTAIAGGTTVFDETVEGGPSSASVADALARARAALQARLGQSAVITGPEQTQSTRTPVSLNPTNPVIYIESGVTTQVTFGPGTILVGPDQSITCLIVAGTTNVNTNTHTETFVTSTLPVQTFLNSVQLQLTGAAALQPIPQVFQNPGAITAILGGIGNGTRNATPVPARPVVASPATQTVASMPALRPPSTGNAGLLSAKD